MARAYIAAAPERMVWGSDWPHPTENEKPDDAVLFDLLSEWAPDDATRHRILVENPAKLYGFPSSYPASRSVHPDATQPSSRARVRAAS